MGFGEVDIESCRCRGGLAERDGIRGVGSRAGHSRVGRGVGCIAQFDLQRCGVGSAGGGIQAEGQPVEIEGAYRPCLERDAEVIGVVCAAGPVRVAVRCVLGGDPGDGGCRGCAEEAEGDGELGGKSAYCARQLRVDLFYWIDVFCFRVAQ